MARDIMQLQIPNSNNITKIEQIIIYSIGIHALPGTKFQINSDKNSQFIIGPSGNFSISFENNPITSIEQVSTPPTTVTYPTIIDIVYERVGEI